MPKIYLDMRAVLTQHSFHCCVDRGDEGVLLERDINLHVDVEGEIVRGWIHVHRKYTCSRAYLEVHTYVVINQSSPLPISSFLPFSPVPSSIYQNSPTHIHTSMSWVFEYTCVCIHTGVHCWQDGVSLRGSNTDGNPSYGSVGWKPLVWVCHVLYYFPIETRETS